jgi:hypothetical protein
MLQRLFQPVDIASLVFFRIVFGILGFADIFGTWIYYHLKHEVFDTDKLQFKYYGFEWVQPFPEPLMSIFFLSLCVLAILIVLGKWYRIATLLFALGFTYTYFLEKSNYLNHGYLFCWICFVMFFLPAHRQFSLDVKKRPALKREQIPYWCLFVMQFMMGVVYFYGGIAKINADWLSAVPLHQWLSVRKDAFLVGPLMKFKETAYFMAYSGMLLDLTAPFFLINKRTRPWFFIAIIFFHLINTLIFAIGIFPPLSLALTALFFRADFPRLWINWIAVRWKKARSWVQRWRQLTATERRLPMWQEEGYRKPIMYGLGLVMVIHLLLPWRHWLYPGDVAWTEEGHRYSWRMMLRSKQGHGVFNVVDKESGEVTPVRPREYLNSKQRRKLFTHPDMILQFAHFLRDKYREVGKEVEVYANIRVRLNFRQYSDYIDPEVDLAAVEWSFFYPSGWILPENKKDE